MKQHLRGYCPKNVNTIQSYKLIKLTPLEAADDPQCCLDPACVSDLTKGACPLVKSLTHGFMLH